MLAEIHCVLKLISTLITAGRKYFLFNSQEWRKINKTLNKLMKRFVSVRINEGEFYANFYTFVPEIFDSNTLRSVWSRCWSLNFKSSISFCWLNFRLWMIISFSWIIPWSSLMFCQDSLKRSLPYSLNSLTSFSRFSFDCRSW